MEYNVDLPDDDIVQVTYYSIQVIVLLTTPVNKCRKYNSSILIGSFKYYIVENIEFDELLANCPSFLPQIYEIFNISICHY